MAYHYHVFLVRDTVAAKSREIHQENIPICRTSVFALSIQMMEETCCDNDPIITHAKVRMVCRRHPTISLLFPCVEFDFSLGLVKEESHDGERDDW